MINLDNIQVYDCGKHSPRKHKIDTVTIHHMAGVMTAKECAEYFKRSPKKASSNICIGKCGDICIAVPLDRRAFSTRNEANDTRSINIEVSNSSIGEPWYVSDESIFALEELLIALRDRYNLGRLELGRGLNVTLHNYFSATACPGKYLTEKLPHILEDINDLSVEDINDLSVESTGESTGDLSFIGYTQVIALAVEKNVKRVRERLDSLDVDYTCANNFITADTTPKKVQKIYIKVSDDNIKKMFKGLIE